MNRLRKQLIIKMRQTQPHLETVQLYLKEVGSNYLERFPERARKYILVSQAIDEIKLAIKKLTEEI